MATPPASLSRTEQPPSNGQTAIARRCCSPSNPLHKAHSPLVSITRADCLDRHRLLTDRRGPTTANLVLRKLRACWNSARARYQELAEHAVRPAQTLNRPDPKAGAERAFTAPLSDAAAALLRRRWENNELDFGYDDRGWVWPTWSQAGRVTYMQESKEQDYWRDEHGKSRKRTALPSPHRLRDAYATAASEAGLGFMAIKVLMNHVLPEGDVTMGYIRPSVEHLREAQQAITAFPLAKAGRESV